MLVGGWAASREGACCVVSDVGAVTGESSRLLSRLSAAGVCAAGLGDGSVGESTFMSSGAAEGGAVGGTLERRVLAEGSVSNTDRSS